MAKETHHETTVIYKCDGCGVEDIRNSEIFAENSHIHGLPEGWSTLLVAEGIDPSLDRVQEGSALYGTLKRTNYSVQSIKPFRKILCCSLCSKKLADLFKDRNWKPPVESEPVKQKGCLRRLLWPFS